MSKPTRDDPGKLYPGSAAYIAYHRWMNLRPDSDSDSDDGDNSDSTPPQTTPHQPETAAGEVPQGSLVAVVGDGKTAVPALRPVSAEQASEGQDIAHEEILAHRIAAAVEAVKQDQMKDREYQLIKRVRETEEEYARGNLVRAEEAARGAKRVKQARSALRSFRADDERTGAGGDSCLSSLQ